MISNSEMTPQSVIDLAPESLAQAEEFAAFFLEEHESGRLDALDVYTKCTAFEKALEMVKKYLQKAATEEAMKYGKEFEKKSFKLKIGEVGVKYIYDNCNDPILTRRESEVKHYKTLVENRQKMLKSLKEPLRVVDEDTGDSFVVNPPVKTSTTSVIVTFK